MLGFSFRLLVDLYHSDDDNLAEMNLSGSGFFMIIRDVLVDHCFLELSAMTDPARSHRHDNLSLERLTEEVSLKRPAINPDAIIQLKAEVKTYQDGLSLIRSHRNKRIAHADADALLDPQAMLDGVRVADLRKAVMEIFGIINDVGNLLQQPEVAFDSPIILGSASIVMGGLRRGRKFLEIERELRWTAVTSGSIETADDLKNRLLEKYFMHPYIRN